MPIDHTYVSPVVDEGDPNKVGPDEWNANHTLPTHAETLGQTANDHHNKLHAVDHAKGGADELEVEDLATDSVDTTKFFQPDGAGGVQLAVPTGLSLGSTPSTQAFGDAAAGGADATASKNDHKHGMMARPTHALLDGVDQTDTLAGAVVAGDVVIGNDTPKWARLGITIPGGAALLNIIAVLNGETTPSWKALFDATNPVTQAFSDAPSPGTSTIAAHRDHKHGMPASPGGAPTTTPYVTILADAGLSAEVVRQQLGNYFLDTYPSSPNAMDDEFDDTSGMSGTNNGLNARWTWRNQSTSTLAYTKAGFVSLAIPAAATNNMRIIEQTLPAGTAWDFACKVNIEGQMTDNCNAGLMAFDGTNSRLFSIHYRMHTGPALGIEVGFWNSVTSFNIAKFTEVSHTASVIHFRMVRSGNDLLLYYASEGAVSWTRIGTFTDATNVPNLTTVGLFCNETNNLGLTKGHFDWFRRLA